MKYGYFKSRKSIDMHKGHLEFYYSNLMSISNIKVYYDHYGDGNPFFYKMLQRLEENDSLYITSLLDLGDSSNKIMTNLEALNDLYVHLFINSQEVNLEKFFKLLDERRRYNVEHLKCQLYDQDIVESVLRDITNL